MRTCDSLFVTINKPHKVASCATLSRWIHTVIVQSGQQGIGGSTCSQITSTAVGQGATLEKVLKAGDWSRASTFRKFYFNSVPLNHLQNVWRNDE